MHPPRGMHVGLCVSSDAACMHACGGEGGSTDLHHGGVPLPHRGGALDVGAHQRDLAPAAKRASVVGASGERQPLGLGDLPPFL